MLTADPVPKISIIIPFYNRYDFIMRRMLEIHTYIHHPFSNLEILMVNNGSNPHTIEEGNVYYWQKMVNWFAVRYLRWEENVGFGGAMNRGAERAMGEYLCLLSDDVMIKGDFLAPLLETLEANPTALVGGEMVWWPGGWNEFEFPSGKVVVPYVNGWLLACSKRCWIEAGGFDPIYLPYDYEDVDLSTRWHEMGYPMIELKNLPVRHIGGGTIGTIDPKRMENTQRHRQQYIAKWADRLEELYRK